MDNTFKFEFDGKIYNTIEELPQDYQPFAKALHEDYLKNPQNYQTRTEDGSTLLSLVLPEKFTKTIKYLAPALATVISGIVSLIGINSASGVVTFDAILPFWLSNPIIMFIFSSISGYIGYQLMKPTLEKEKQMLTSIPILTQDQIHILMSFRNSVGAGIAGGFVSSLLLTLATIVFIFWLA
jgi:hypothetical protein